MPIYHVNVYKIAGKLELDLEAKNLDEAQEKALEIAERDKDSFMPCKLTHLIECQEYKSVADEILNNLKGNNT